MELFYTSVNDLVKEFSAPRKSQNPFKHLSDKEVAFIAQSDAVVLAALDKDHPDEYEPLKKFIPFEKVKPHLIHGVLAESIFRKTLRAEGLVYEELRLAERQERRKKAAIQAYVDLVRDGVFDEDILSGLGDNLPAPSPVVARGRPPRDLETMFRCVMLGCRHRLSDKALHRRLCENVVTRRAVGISRVNDIPAPQTIWYYREAWAQHNSMLPVFEISLQHIISLIPDEFKEQIGKCIGVDGSFVEAEKRHVSAIVHKLIIDGKDPVDIFENPAERRQRDVDARHTKKNNESHFGYKVHAKVCLFAKLILKVFVSPANLHDSQTLPELFDSNDTGAMVLADSAYNGKKQREYIESVGAKPFFIKKVSEIKKLTDDPLEILQKLGQLYLERNSEISRCRVRIEHVFAHIQNSFGGSFVRSVSQIRAHAYQLLTACCYNAERMRTLLA